MNSLQKTVSSFLMATIICTQAQVQALECKPQSWGDPVNGLSSRLTLVDGSKVGEPLKVRLELRNQSKEARAYDSQQAAVNGSLEVTGPDGKPVSYMALTYQTAGQRKTLQPDEAVTIFDSLDVSDQYLLLKPGAYSIRFKGRDTIPPSNVLTVQLESGVVSTLTQLYDRMQSIQPEGWRLAKSGNAILISRSPTRLKRDVVTVQVWFTKEKDSGYPDPKRGPSNMEYVGETRLGHAWLSADDGARTHWPKYGDSVRGILREFGKQDVGK